MDTKTQAMLGVLENQRNQALNAVVQLAGENAELKEQLRIATEAKKPALKVVKAPVEKANKP